MKYQKITLWIKNPNDTENENIAKSVKSSLKKECGIEIIGALSRIEDSFCLEN